MADLGSEVATRKHVIEPRWACSLEDSTIWGCAYYFYSSGLPHDAVLSHPLFSPNLLPDLQYLAEHLSILLHATQSTTPTEQQSEYILDT